MEEGKLLSHQGKDCSQLIQIIHLCTSVSHRQTKQMVLWLCGNKFPLLHPPEGCSTSYEQGVSRSKNFLVSLLCANQAAVPTWETCSCMQGHGAACSPTASPHRKESWRRVGISLAAAVGSAGTMCTWCSGTWLMGSSITGTASGTALQSGGTGLWVTKGQPGSLGTGGRVV